MEFIFQSGTLGLELETPELIFSHMLSYRNLTVKKKLSSQ